MLAALSAHYGITRGAAVMALRRARQRARRSRIRAKETSALYVLPSAPINQVGAPFWSATTAANSSPSLTAWPPL